MSLAHLFLCLSLFSSDHHALKQIYTTFIYWTISNDFNYGTTSQSGGSDDDEEEEGEDGEDGSRYERCATLWQCLVTAYDEGLRQDVGLAEHMVGLQVYKSSQNQ